MEFSGEVVRVKKEDEILWENVCESEAILPDFSLDEFSLRSMSVDARNLTNDINRCCSPNITEIKSEEITCSKEDLMLFEAREVPDHQNVATVKIKSRGVANTDDKDTSCGSRTSKNMKKTTKKQVATSSPGKQLFPCSCCSATFRNKTALYRHKKSFQEKVTLKPFSCTLCSATFLTQWKLEHHQPKHSNEKRFTCPHCPTSFKFKGSLYSHLKSFPDENHTRENLIKRFSCDICSSSFGWKSHLQVHIRSKHGREKPFVCSQCGAKFERQAKLNRHSSIHSFEKPFACAHCSSLFKSKEGLKKHLMVSDELHPPLKKQKLKRFQCTPCQKTFNSQSSLNDHVIVRHDKSKPFPCKECLSRFESRGELKGHSSVHSNERLFFCAHCPARFKFERGLKRHMKDYPDENHDVTNRIKHYACSLCQQRFCSVTNLNHHIRSKHDEKGAYSCGICSAELKTEAEFKIHISAHSNGKLLCCAHCPAKFRTKKCLKQHLKRHPQNNRLNGGSTTCS